jgi:glucans biosynthesis protein
VEISAFADNGPRRFGLYQVPRSYESFEDTEARYHDRPSAFVAPLEDWGEGAVMLVELPTGDEFLDNIVAFWRPKEALQPGEAYRFAYRLTWTRAAPSTAGLPPISQSRSGREHDQPGKRRFVVDVATRLEDPVPVLTSEDGTAILGASAFALPQNRGTRITFLFDPGARDAAELRLSLRSGDNTPHSPVWLHRWTRARDGGV